MFTIYVNSFDVRRIIKTIQERTIPHRGVIFQATSNSVRINNESFVVSLDCLSKGDDICRLALRERGHNVVRSTELSIDDLELLLKKFEITAKVDNFIVKIEISDIVEFGETCPNCDHETCGVTDSSLISTCEECGEELMICSFCPTHCSEKDDEVCESCIFSGMDCSFPCNCNSGEGCHMKLRAKNIKTF
jgi:hypothetical protein